MMMNGADKKKNKKSIYVQLYITPNWFNQSPWGGKKKQ